MVAVLGTIDSRASVLAMEARREEDVTYPTIEAWEYFLKHLDDIREVVKSYGVIARFEVPNTRLVDRDRTACTTQRDSIPLAVKYEYPLFEAAILAKDTNLLYDIMNDAWLRASEDRGRAVYRVPGFSEMCYILDFTIEGFVDDDSLYEEQDDV